MGLIQTAESIEQHVKDAYTALQANGASLPEQRNLANLAGCIGENSLNLDNYCIFSNAKNAGKNLISAPASLILSSYNWAQDFVYNARSNNTGSILVPVYQDSTAWGLNSVQKSWVLEMKLDFNGRSFSSTSLNDFWFAGGSSSTSCINLKKLSILGAPIIGNYFAMGGFSGADDEIVLDSTLISIGKGFLETSKFNGHIKLPPSLEAIGTEFCSDCNNLKGVYIPEGVAPPDDDNSLSTLNVTAPSYVNGITLTGPGAAVWKAALPDRTSSPYRKLILG